MIVTFFNQSLIVACLGKSMLLFYVQVYLLTPMDHATLLNTKSTISHYPLSYYHLFDTISECDRHTITAYTTLSIASRGKNMLQDNFECG